jgi:hypothetical protein
LEKIRRAKAELEQEEQTGKEQRGFRRRRKTA